MFTGLISDVAVIASATESDGGRDICVQVDWDDILLGESVAVNGACLTVTKIQPDGFCAHVVATSLARTTFGEKNRGDSVNLERALRVGDRLGGHIVQGHVDGIGTVTAVSVLKDTRLIEIVVPDGVADVSIPLGSIAVDGVSLTINAVPTQGTVQLAIVPFTLEKTSLGKLVPGDRVHLEGDVVGKHVRSLTRVWRSEESQ
jgi:riboflavin synthase